MVHPPHGCSAVLHCKASSLKMLLLVAMALVESGDGVRVLAVAVSMSPQATNGLVTLQCFCDDVTCGGKITWERRLNGTVQQVTAKQQPVNVSVFTFVLTPQLEGAYFCVANGTRSNEVVLVANLAPDPAISAVSQYQVHAGDSITLPCAFRPGALSSNYSLEWQKQLATIYRPQGISLPQRYRILENYSLVISGAEVTDSNLYQCSVRVTYSNGPTITGYAPPFRLIVIAPLRITQAPTTVTLTSSKMATFSCKVSGSPRPQVTWIHADREVDGGNSGKYTLSEGVVTSTQVYQVTSTLTIGGVEAGDSGAVTCVAVVPETQQVATGNADLIVLSCVSSVQLQVMQDGSVQIKVAMAAVIPGPFGLVLSYTPSPPSQSFGSYVTQLTDLSFADVQKITYTIPQQRLPVTFNSFSVKVALMTRGVQGDVSNDSNVVTLTSGGSASNAAVSGSDCHCDNTPLVVVIVVFLVVLLVVVVAVVVAVVVVLWYKHRNKEISVELEYRDSSSDDRKNTLNNRKASCASLDSGELAKMEDQAVRAAGSRTLPGRVRRTKEEGAGNKALPHSRSVENVSLPHPPTAGGVYLTLQRDGEKHKSHCHGNIASPPPLFSPPPYAYNTAYRKNVLSATNPLHHPTTDV